jgi:hypothetical protein
MKQFWYLLTFFACFSVTAQQTVHLKLNQMMLEESFSEFNEVWPVMTNNDNFFVFDKGEYFMNRTKRETPYAVLANWQNDLNSFAIRASIMLGPVESADQSLGLIFRASADGQSALICDINKLHRFRVRRLTNGRYETLTDGKNGWIKNSAIKGINEYNNIEVKSNGTDHDLYINGMMVYNFRIEDMTEGSFGLFIGPETKGRVDYYNIYADELYRDQSKIYLSDDEIRELIKENEELKLDLEQSLDARALELQNAIRILENQLKAMRLVNEQLEEENTQYAIIKSAVDTTQTNLLVDLSHKLINHTLENRQLKIQNNLINDSIVRVKKRFEDLELELFQKVIDKNLDEQAFMDSILSNFCNTDTIYMSFEQLQKDSLELQTTLLDSLLFDSLSNDSLKIDTTKGVALKIDSVVPSDTTTLEIFIPETE